MTITKDAIDEVLEEMNNEAKKGLLMENGALVSDAIKSTEGFENLVGFLGSRIKELDPEDQKVFLAWYKDSNGETRARGIIPYIAGLSFHSGLEVGLRLAAKESSNFTEVVN